jgi:hypothetical protein
VSLKKPAVKTKDKIPHRAEIVAAVKEAAAKEKVANRPEGAPTKRKPAAEPKESNRVMDARANKDRRQEERRQKELPVEVCHRTTERRVKVNRRRQIDPTTCERDYSPEEIEFMGALDDYKRKSGRMFPTCSEILEVFRSLGYQKPVELPTIAQPVTSCSVTSEQAAV